MAPSVRARAKTKKHVFKKSDLPWLEECVQTLERDGYPNMARMLYEEMVKVLEDAEENE
jgi:hypothetical protein